MEHHQKVSVQLILVKQRLFSLVLVSSRTQFSVIFFIGDSSLRVQPSDRLCNLGVNLDIESSILQKGYASDSIHW